MRYCPLPSVIAVRTFSIRAGLEASTVTPGSTASEASRTTPARVACANAIAGLKKRNPTRTVAADSLLISGASCGNVWGTARHAGQSDVRLVYTLTKTSRQSGSTRKCSRCALFSADLQASGSRVVTGHGRVITSHGRVGTSLDELSRHGWRLARLVIHFF